METTALTIKRSPDARESFRRAVKIRETWRLPISTAASYMVTKATLTAPFETSTRRSRSIRTTSRPCTVAASHIATKAYGTAPSKTTTRQSNSIRTTSKPSAIAATPTSLSANMIAPSKTTTRRSSLIPTRPFPSIIVAVLTTKSAKLTALFKTSTRCSSLIRKTPTPSEIALWPSQGKKLIAAARSHGREPNPEGTKAWRIKEHPVPKDSAGKALSKFLVGKWEFASTRLSLSGGRRFRVRRPTGRFLWGAHQIERSSLWQPHSNRSHDFLSVDAQILQGPPKAVSIFTGFLPKMSCVTASPPAMSPRYEQRAFSLQPPGTIMFICRWVNTQ